VIDFGRIRNQAPSCTNNNGNLIGESIYAGGPTYTQSYNYTDGLNRLSSATESGVWTQTYVYDAFGNRAVLAGSWVPNSNQTPQTNSTSSVPYNANNQWTLGTYDPSGNGNMTWDGLNSMTYYADNLLWTSSNSNSGSVTYYYDGDGHRVQKVVTAGATTTYVYDAQGQLAAEYSTSAPPALCATCWLTADHLGSTRMLTDSNGVVQRRYDFLPFGEEIPQGINGRTAPYETGLQVTTPDTTDVKFTAKSRDSESNLDFFGARYFSGSQGRFSTPDAVFADQRAANPQSWNLYGYVRNNPLHNIDPTGRGTFGDIAWGIPQGTGSFILNNFMPYMAFKAIQQTVNDLRNPAAAQARDQATAKAVTSLTTAQGRQAAATAVGNAWNGMTTTDKTATVTQAVLIIATVAVGAPAMASQAGEAAAVATRAAASTSTDVYVIGHGTDPLSYLGQPGFNVLNVENWTPALNDAWVESGVDSGSNFLLSSDPLNSANLFSEQYGQTMFATELDQLNNVTYTQVGNQMVAPGSANIPK
jgi:RHS repeat-associated protein